MLSQTLMACLVYRVSFLRAKCRWERWEEEARLVSHEMLWTRLAFERQ